MTMLTSTFFSAPIDALLVSNVNNKRYLTGFSGSGGYALLTPQRCVLLVPGKYVEQLKQQRHDHRVINTDALGFLVCLQQQLTELGIQRLGFEAQSVSYADVCAWRAALTPSLVPTYDEIEMRRQCKHAHEITLITHACALTERAIEQGLAQFHEGMTETALALHIEWAARQLGADSIDFLIVVSGVRGAFPHGRPSDKAITAGELVTIDAGIVYQGYHSDVTRTFCVGQVSAQQQHIVDIVQQAQQLGVSMLGVGVSTHDIDTTVRQFITDAGYGEYFTHGLGHGVGLQGHEKPFLQPQQDTQLEQGMVVTIEPGIYIPQWGGVRIEDTLVITADGATSLTQLPRHLRDIHTVSPRN